MDYLTVAFAAQLGNGKDESADYLARRLDALGHRFIRKGFATAVKKIFCDTFHVDMDFVEKWKRVPEPPPGFDLPVRDCLILIGDGFRRMKGDLWIVEAFHGLTSHQIISDCRYYNEAVYNRDRGGVNILLWRPGHENDIQNDSEQQLVPYIKTLAARRAEGYLNDPSIPFDLFLINEGTKEDLFRKVDDLVVPLVLKRLGR